MALKKLIRKGNPPHRRPSLEPQEIDATTWFYDGLSGITLVHEFRDREKHLRTDQIFLSWKKLMAAAQRCRKV